MTPCCLHSFGEPQEERSKKLVDMLVAITLLEYSGVVGVAAAVPRQRGGGQVDAIGDGYRILQLIAAVSVVAIAAVDAS